MPRSKGGTDKDDNLALACQGCNNRKYTHVEARDPVTGKLVSLYHPRRQRWADHFGWNEDRTYATVTVSASLTYASVMGIDGYLSCSIR
jgi:hypothetical protein